MAIISLLLLSLSLSEESEEEIDVQDQMPLKSGDENSEK